MAEASVIVVLALLGGMAVGSTMATPADRRWPTAAVAIAAFVGLVLTAIFG